jgi:DNA polymerase II large subunit
MIADPEVQKYFQHLEDEVSKLYTIAKVAREKGFDAVNGTEIYKASDLAARVEGLLGIKGIAARIRELDAKMSREETAFKIIEEIVNGKFGAYEDWVAADYALRTALAIVTEGITAAPLQGIEKVEIKRNLDNTSYLAVHYAGPMRSAGGTEQALTVLFADYIRILLHLDRYKVTEEEVGRFIEELRLYERKVTRFQYHPSDEDLRRILRYVPVEVTGPPTDPPQVSVYRNLDRIATNRVRGGALRVINDGVYGKAAKLKKIVDKVGITDWDWLRVKKDEKQDDIAAKIMPDSKYLVDVVGGRPIFSHPSVFGGFRLRYGRARNTGIASVGISPATMVILESFIAVGTQLRVERPGKSSTITPVDTIEGPVVKLKSGDVVRVEDEITAERVRPEVAEILFLGDMVISVGEFLENNHRLMPAGYCEEIWSAELRKIIEEKFEKRYDILADRLGLDEEQLRDFVDSSLVVKPSAEESLELSRLLGIPLHPKYTYFWENISVDEILVISEWLKKPLEAWTGGELWVPLSDPVPKKILEKVAAPHRVSGGRLLLENPEVFKALFSSPVCNKGSLEEDPIKYLCDTSCIKVRAKGRSFIGARMGRPEKAKERVMRPPIHALFPVGLGGGPKRDLGKAVGKGGFEASLILRMCEKCKTVTHESVCRKCNSPTIRAFACPNCGGAYESGGSCQRCGAAMVPFSSRLIRIDNYDRMLADLGVPKTQLVKGVRGLSNPTKVPEVIEKGILRSKHRIFVYKDGTVRFDLTNAPLTHFKPSEVGVSIGRLRELGYTHDCMGKELTEGGQLVELMVQDIIVPYSCAKYLHRVSIYVDELLVKLYGMEPYYRLNSPSDMVGQSVIGLAPHTSAGIVGRVIGFTKASVCYAHPFWHAAKRRNCDGDEDAVMLLLEALLDFSKEFLPEKIGGLMDAPLVLTTVIDPSEVDDECHNMETVEHLPLEFFKLAEDFRDPKEALKVVEIMKMRLGKPEQYTHLWAPIYTQGIDRGPITTAYDKLKTMMDKVDKQLELANRIRAVDSKDVAERLLKHHFIPDLAGNMRAFSTQTFRCTKCGAKFRRVPLKGSCSRCGGNVILTVHEGNINKYLNAAFALSSEYELGTFVEQQITLIKMGLRSLIPEKTEKKKDQELSQFFSSEKD